jgi:carbon-monoxide dehydrogenase medium subunit
MYPAPFNYHRAHSVEQAIELLGQIGDGARVLAGGQSLLPMLKLRFDEPTDLVDVGRIGGLDGIELSADEARIGALATHRRIADSGLAAAIPIVADCANGIADYQVRSRGTIGGSVASGDPACDWPVLLHALDAKVRCQGPNGERTLDINGFVEDLYQTVLQPGELVTGIGFAVPAKESGGAYCAFKRCAPAYPTVSVGLHLSLSGGEVRKARIALGSSGPTPIRAREAESELEGGAITADRLDRAAEAAVAAASPFDDQRGTAAFKRHLIATLVRRAAGIAERRAKGETVKNSHEYY